MSPYIFLNHQMTLENMQDQAKLSGCPAREKPAELAVMWYRLQTETMHMSLVLVWGTLYPLFSSPLPMCQAASEGYTNLTWGVCTKQVILYPVISCPERGSHYFYPPSDDTFSTAQSCFDLGNSRVMLCCGLSL